MKRSTIVAAALAGATILGPAGAATAAEQTATGLPLTPWEGEVTDTGLGLPSELPTDSGSAQSGSVTGFETTGSSGNGSFGVPNLDRLLFGGRILCGALGSALAVAGEAMMDCRNLPS